MIGDAFPTARMHELGHNLVSLKDDQFCFKATPHTCIYHSSSHSLHCKYNRVEVN